MKSYILATLFCTSLLLNFSCTKEETSIIALVESDREGNCILKWEVFPERDNTTMEIYASDNDSSFPLHPLKNVDVNKYIDVIENADSLGYRFFKLKVGNTYSPIISNRFHRFDDVQNFRDIGGYVTNDGRTVKWGKIFRAGDFSHISKLDDEQLEKLNLKTVIDLRAKKTQQNISDILKTPHRYELYISGIYNDSISEKVLENKFLKGDALIYMQDAYRSILIEHTKQYSDFFDYLTNEENYPLVFHCSLGKDQSGIASFLLLRALDVPVDIAEEDYVLSNRGVNRRKIIKDPSHLSEVQQQIFTMLTSTDISYLRYALACARKEEGSIDDFMTKRLNLTQEKRKKLKDILLYEK